MPVLTRIEAPSQIARSVPWFPVVGAGVGVVIAGVFAASLLILPPLVSAVLAIAAGAALTGGLHEDGLGDVADAFGGGWDRDDVIRILKDPVHGTYGVLAIAVSLLIRVGAMAELSAWDAAAAIPAAHALSRSAAVWIMATFNPAAEGLGASYSRELTNRQALVGGAAGIGLAFAFFSWWGLLAPVLVLPPALWIARVSQRRIGGISGDVLGAVQQIAEIVVLLFAVALIRTGLGNVGWWNL